MRVLQVNNYSRVRGGADRYFHDLSKALTKSADVKMFATKSICSDSLENQNLFWRDLPRELDISGATNFDSILYFWRKDIEKKITECIDEFLPDVIHCHIFHGQISAVLLRVAAKRGIPVVQTLHDFKMICGVDSMIRDGSFCGDCGGKNFWPAVVHKCNRNSYLRSLHSAIDCSIRNLAIPKTWISKYIFVSEYQRRIYAKYFPTLDGEVIENFSEQPKPISTDIINEKFLLYPTRVESGKGIDRLLSLYETARDSGIVIPKCIVVGDGDLMDHFHKRVEVLQMQDVIVFKGRLSKPELNHYYHRCLGVLNLSSLNETFGLTVIEAFSHGKWCIVSENGALPDLISDERLGLKLDFTKKLPHLLDSIVQFLSLSSQADKFILKEFESKYSENVHVDRMLNLYKNVVY